jgi:Raf kinase inhibitor-like YbhB/YbcL family protein
MIDYAMKAYKIYRKFSGRAWLSIMAVFILGCITMTVNSFSAEGTMQFALKSTAFDNGDPIPAKHTCEGEDLSPPLQWEGVPEQARSLVLIVDDPDAPDPKAPKMTWVHWVLYNMPADAAVLPEGVKSENLPSGTKEGMNDWKRTGYGGPCPPRGRHRYFHKLYALDTILKGLHRPTKAQVESSMKGHIIAKAELVGTYEKSKMN